MFIHLRVSSDYSLLQSTLKIKELIKLTIKHKMPAIGLTDNNLFGSLEFSEYAVNHGVQPILGCNLIIKYKELMQPLLFLIKDETGYKNLIYLVSKSYKQPITFEELKNKNTGLIVLSGDLLLMSIKNNFSTKEILYNLTTIFKGNFYIELQRHGTIFQQKIEPFLIKIARSHNLPLVATNNTLFATKDFFEAHDALTCIASGKYLVDSNRSHFTHQHYFKSSEEMLVLFQDLPEAVANTIQIAKRCAFILETKAPTLPVFSTTQPEDIVIREQAYEGLKIKLISSDIPELYLKRLEYELSIIIAMQYAGYFLIVSDFIKWSKKNGIPVGPGRGSGVGSLVAWALDITELDPLKFGLIFERFLNPERISMPDFDIDFCQEKRGLVIDYIKNKYGDVAHIITFGKLQPRAVLRDVGRVLQIPYNKVDQICKMIPNNPVNPVTLSQAIHLDKNLQQEIESDENIKKLANISLKLEGLYRHASTHAAGIVISEKPLLEVIPLYYEPNTKIPITQYSMKYVEKAGLVKFDFLGLKTLTIIDEACKIIKKKYPHFSLSGINLSDKKTFDMLGEGKSIGIFQLENAFMQETLKKLKPDTLEDIIALISLNRPGPMDNIPTYIARKHNKETIEYIHPLLQGLLRETFGVIIYQEQVMEIAQVLSGYTLAEADILRRAMGKKIKSEMDKQKEKFIKGASLKGVGATKAGEIFDLVEKFAGYGFNKSHAAAYALISYQTAYLKANYTTEFIVALLNCDINLTDKIHIFCQEAKKLGISLLPPDINHSNVQFIIENQSIRYSLNALKNVGEVAAKEIKKYTYNTINDFINLVDKKVINKKTIESLIKSGAFDSLAPNRKKLYSTLPHLLKNSDNKNNTLQANLFNDSEYSIFTKDIEDWNILDKSQQEFEVIGFYLHNHPVEFYKKVFPAFEKGGLAGVITAVRIRSSNRGKFAIVMLSTPDNIYTILFYDSALISTKSHLFEEGKQVLIFIQNTLERFIGTGIYTIEQFISNTIQNKKILVHVKTKQPLKELKVCLEERGKTNIVVRLEKETSIIDFELPGSYNLNIQKIIYTENLKISMH